jgi:phosphonate transport system substrate-binding protein
MRMKNLFIKVSILFFFVIYLSVAQVHANDYLTLWVHPYLLATELINKFSPLAAYLSKKIGHPVEVKISKSYQSHIKKVGEDQIGLAYMGPASYVKMTHSYGKKTVLAGLEVNGKPFFHGMIITLQNSAITTLQDLQGKRFAFGDPNSTMGHLVPRYMLWKTGIDLENLDKYEFLGSHNNVALGVLGGYYDAGGVKEGVFYKYRKRGLKMLAKSPPLAEHLFVASNKLPEATISTLRQSLVNLRDKTILSAIKKSVTGMVVVKDADYDPLRTIIQQFDGQKAE